MLILYQLANSQSMFYFTGSVFYFSGTVSMVAATFASIFAIKSYKSAMARRTQDGS